MIGHNKIKLKKIVTVSYLIIFEMIYLLKAVFLYLIH